MHRLHNRNRTLLVAASLGLLTAVSAVADDSVSGTARVDPQAITQPGGPGTSGLGRATDQTVISSPDETRRADQFGPPAPLMRDRRDLPNPTSAAAAEEKPATGATR